MTPERWREIERLYHAALPRDAGERAAFLADACGADEELRREVESLFEYQARATSFIEIPAVEGRLADAVRRHEQSFVPGRFVGRTFGSYDMQAFIASGGMAEVYRAVDRRLNRTVAIKTLPEHLSNEPERRERFQREAQIISSLNHPHICTLHDVGMQGDVLYLVMEYIDGETLQARLARGPVPIAQALEYVVQICDALDKAHRRGIVHRDLKPANVMLTKAGVKLLDFGLAKLAPAKLSPPASRQSTSLTTEGTILGTFQYMAPEQLEGKPADARTDIFAFGALAYEMITGRKPFPAANRAQLIGAILKDDPQPIAELVPEVPPSLAEALTRCLAKDPDERWQTANDLLYQLRAIDSSPTIRGSRESQTRRVAHWIERVAWTALVVAAVVGALLWSRGRDAGPRDPGRPPATVRYALTPAAGMAFHSGFDLPFALAPDGRHIVYVGIKADGTKQLCLHPLYSGLEPQPMAGTDDASGPFWSPDSEWVGFFAGNSLKKVRVSSGLVQPIASNVSSRGGASWNTADVIVFRSGPGGMVRVSARGGAVVPVATTNDPGFWPQFLGDGTHFLYAAPTSATIEIGSLEGGRSRTLMKFPVRISSLAYVPGYVFYVQDATLFARPFDETRLEFSGDPMRIVDGIPVTGPGRAAFSVSAAGVLAYSTYPIGTPAALHWFERDGRASVAVAAPAQYVGFALSPDASKLAFSRMAKAGGADLWIRDLSNGAEHQFTYDGAAFTPQWSPEGTRIAFTGPGERPPPKLFVKSVVGAGAASQVGISTALNFASSWSGDGRAIVTARIGPATQNDLWVHRLADAVDERLSFNTPFNESHGRVSLDNRWIAYDTDASGKTEVWVASFPSGAVRRQVSAGGGVSPEWSEGSTEIVYISDDKRLMAARVSAAPTGIEVGTPRALFHIENLTEIDALGFPTSNAYLAASNGQRFLVAVRTRDPNAPPINIVVNWPALLDR
jgi:eukaryotic-like serine/threonine-protein kinase